MAATWAAVVPQQTFLFDDTVRGNVTLGLAPPLLFPSLGHSRSGIGFPAH